MKKLKIFAKIRKSFQFDDCEERAGLAAEQLL